MERTVFGERLREDSGLGLGLVEASLELGFEFFGPSRNRESGEGVT